MATKLNPAAQILLQQSADTSLETAVAASTLVKEKIQNPGGLQTFEQLTEAPDNPFGAGLKSGTRQVKGDFQTFGAGIDLVQAGEEGSKNYAKEMAAAEINFQQAARQEELANEIRDSFVKFPEAFDSFDNFVEFALFQTGQVVPQIVSMIGGGLTTAVTYGAGKTVLAGAAKRYTRNKMKNILDKKVAGIKVPRHEDKMIDDAYQGVLHAMNKGKYGSTAEGAKDIVNILDKAGKFNIDNKILNSRNAFWLGGFGSSYVMNSAQSLNEYGDQGFELTGTEAKLAAAYGIPIAALDTMSSMLFFGAITKTALKDAAKATTRAEADGAMAVVLDIAKSFGVNLTKQAGIEGTTEALQEGGLILQRTKDPIGKLFGVSPGTDDSYTFDQGKMRILESFTVGAITGGARAVPQSVVQESYKLLNQGIDEAEAIKQAQAKFNEDGSPVAESQEDITGQIIAMLDQGTERETVWIEGLDSATLQSAAGSTILDLTGQNAEAEQETETETETTDPIPNEETIIQNAKKAVGESLMPNARNNETYRVIRKNFGAQGLKIYIETLYKTALDNLAKSNRSPKQKADFKKALEEQLKTVLKDEGFSTAEPQVKKTSGSASFLNQEQASKLEFSFVTPNGKNGTIKGERTGAFVFNRDSSVSLDLQKNLSRAEIDDTVLGAALNRSGPVQRDETYAVVVTDPQGRMISKEVTSFQNLQAAMDAARTAYPNSKGYQVTKGLNVESQGTFKQRQAVEDDYDYDPNDDPYTEDDFQGSTETELSSFDEDMSDYLNSRINEDPDAPKLGAAVESNPFGDKETVPVDMDVGYVSTNARVLTPMGGGQYSMEQYSRGKKLKGFTRENTKEIRADQGRWGRLSDIENPNFRQDRTPDLSLIKRFIEAAKTVNPALAEKIQAQMGEDFSTNNMPKSLMNTFIEAVDADPNASYNIIVESGIDTQTQEKKQAYRITKEAEDTNQQQFRDVLTQAQNVANTLERPEVNKSPFARNFKIVLSKRMSEFVGPSQDEEIDTPVFIEKTTKFLQGKSKFPQMFVNMNNLLQNYARYSGIDYDLTNREKTRNAFTSLLAELEQNGMSLQYKQPYETNLEGQSVVNTSTTYTNVTDLTGPELLDMQIPVFVSTSKTGRAKVDSTSLHGIFTKGKTYTVGEQDIKAQVESSSKGRYIQDYTNSLERLATLAAKLLDTSEATVLLSQGEGVTADTSDLVLSRKPADLAKDHYLYQGEDVPIENIVERIEAEQQRLQFILDAPIQKDISKLEMLGGVVKLQDLIVQTEFLEEQINDVAYKNGIDVSSIEGRGYDSQAPSMSMEDESAEFALAGIRKELGEGFVITGLDSEKVDFEPYRTTPKDYSKTSKGTTTISPDVTSAFAKVFGKRGGNVFYKIDGMLRKMFKNHRNISLITNKDVYKRSNNYTYIDGKPYSRQILITQAQNKLTKNNEPAMFVSFGDEDVIIVNTDNLNKNRAGEVFVTVIHEFGHSIIEDNFQSLFKSGKDGKINFRWEQLEEDFIKAREELRAKGSTKYDGKEGREEYVADRIASLGLQNLNVTDPKLSSADSFLLTLYKKIKTFLRAALKEYPLERFARRDIDPDIVKALTAWSSTNRRLNMRGEYKARKMADASYEQAKKMVGEKQARQVSNFVQKLWRGQFGPKNLADGKYAHLSMDYILSTSAGYLRSQSEELGKAIYGLTQSDEDFGYKRTVHLISNQYINNLLDTLPKDKNGEPSLQAFEQASAIAESSLATSDITDPTAKALRNFLDTFYTTYITPKQSKLSKEDQIQFAKNFFPRLWDMAYLRTSEPGRVAIAQALLDANKGTTEFIDMGRSNEKLDAKQLKNWIEFVDNWLSSDQDLQDIDVQDVGENLSVGMNKSRAEYFRKLKTEDIRNADPEALSPPHNALRRYVQDTVKRVEYDNALRTTYTPEDAKNMEEQNPLGDNVKRIEATRLISVDKIDTEVYGWQAAEVMLSRIKDPVSRQGARSALEATLGKHGAGMSPLMRNINSWVLFANMVAYLSFATLASAPDLAGPVLRSKGVGGFNNNIGNIVGELKYYFNNKETARKFARDLGVVSYDSVMNTFIDASELGYMNNTTKTLAAGFFKITMLDMYTRFTRTFAAGMGERFIESLTEEPDSVTNQRLFKELGITRQEGIDWVNANKETTRGQRDFTGPGGEKVKMAVAQFVEESILRPSGAERPAWANNPYFALVFQLKSFFYAFGKNIIGGTSREMQNRYREGGLGSAAIPLYIAGLTLLPLTAIGLEFRELLKFMANGGDATQFSTNNMDYGEYFFELLDRSGVFGPLALLFPVQTAGKYGDNPLLPILGPTAERFEDYILKGDVINNKEDVFWDFVPLASGLDLDYFPN